MEWDMKMKIVFVSQPLSTGGAERVVAALANRFSELGHEVKIFIVANGDENTYFTRDEVELIYIKKPKNPMMDLVYRAYKIRKYLNAYKPDVVLPFTTQKNVSVLLATLLSKHKVIISERNNPYKDPTNKGLRILRKLLYWTAEGFVFQTEDAKCFFSESIQKRSCIIANPINESIPDLWSGEREKRIVMVNRLTPQKNIPMAIDAWKAISQDWPEYRMEIYGRGSLEEELKAYTRQCRVDNKIEFKGFCADVTKQIRNAEIYLMTSDYEGMSNSLMEALAMGLVCVSTDHPTGGARALISHQENGMLFPVGDTDACIRALKEVLSSKELREKISRNAVRIREKQSIETIAEHWLSYINSIKET